MKFEFLPTEILFDIFDNLNGSDLLRAFYGLNYRFNLLLYQQYPFYRFRFNSSSKRDFDQICQQHLPNIADQVIALALSDYIRTPQQIELFFSYIPSLRPFTNLQSLSLSNLQTYQLLLNILEECQHLPRLTQLELYSGSFQNSVANFQMVIDKIWSLSTLTICEFNLEIQDDQIFCLPTVTNSSLKRLTIYNPDLKWNQINQLIEYTPRLKSLLVYIKYFPASHNYQDVKLSTLTKCDVCVCDEILGSNSDIIFQAMPNLRYLAVSLWSQLIDGHKWRQIIRDYLPKLKTFHLQMKKRFSFVQNSQEKVDEMISSFRTPFWIDERKWFVRCFTEDKTIYLDTISNPSNHYDTIIPDTWQSTFPDDSQQQLYNHVTHIYNSTFFHRTLSPDIRLPNINHVSIEFPINDQFWSIIPNLHKLKTLHVSSYTSMYRSEVQRILDRAIDLETLHIAQNQSLLTQTSIFNIRHTAIRHVNLNNYKHYFNEQECLLLIQSSLGVQCEVLSILVTNCQCIIRLTGNMPNLRSLTVKCMDTQYNQLAEENNKMILWLKKRLPSTYVIVRDSQYDNSIVIWK